MTREERINSALLPILEKMREHGATDEMCKMYDNGFHVGAMWADAHPHWISVEEGLPPYGEQVLVYAQEDPECGLWWSRRYTEDKAKFMSIDGETEYQVLTDKNGFASMRDENDEPLQVSHWQKIKPPVLSNSGNTGKDLKGGEE